MTGQTIAHYEIIDKLGEGGMGVVYKARDTHLDRFVAIKVLPPEKVANPDRKRRFVQEAKAASALNHPNIVHIYDIDQQDGMDYIAMEYVAGKTLDLLIPRHGLRVNEVLKYAVQMADALARAHGAGIIHRDLKPGNIMVSEDGLAKVLDFGLAKLAESSNKTEDDVTRTQRPQTDEGMIVGTASYMSPEQAEGKQVDARSDIFSFGAVLYEMVTGQRAFQGDSSMSTIAAILNKEPKPAGEIVPTTPHDLAKIINRCLRKDPEKRFQGMADLKVALAELKEESDSGKLAAPSVVAVTNPRRLLWISAAAVLVVAVASAWFLRREAPPPEAAMTSAPLTAYAGSEFSPTFSPDGNQVAFVWNGNAEDNYDIYVKLIGAEPPLRLTTDPAPDLSPAWSPDGRSIAFLRRTGDMAEVLLIPALGGPERKVVEVRLLERRWGFGLSSPAVAWSPHGDWLVFPDASSADGLQALFLFSMKTGERKRLTSPPKASEGDSGVAISPDGERLAFIRSLSVSTRHLYLLPLSSDLRPAGEPERIATNLQNCYSPAWTSDGKEIVLATSGLANRRLWRVPASGSAAARPLAVGESGEEPAISQQGNRLAYSVGAADLNIWRLATSGEGTNQPVKLIASTRQDSNAQYSPDGKRIAFASARSGDMEIWACKADGSSPVQLTSFRATSSGTPRWAPDSRRIVFDSNKEGRYQIYSIDAGGGIPQRLTNNPLDDAAASWSWDGRQIYFSSKRTGRWEVWKMPAEAGEPVQVTHGGGFSPFESPDRRWVYYQKTEGNSEVWKVAVDGGPESKVLDPVGDRKFAVLDQGIYFISHEAATSTLRFFRFATGETREIARIRNRTTRGLSVSPDGRSLIYTQVDQIGGDLILVENFR